MTTECSHQPVEVHAYDSVNGVWQLDDDGNPITIATLCVECSGPEVMGALEDCEWCEGDSQPWPCSTIQAKEQA